MLDMLVALFGKRGSHHLAGGRNQESYLGYRFQMGRLLRDPNVPGADQPYPFFIGFRVYWIRK
jgi:hypothetical protein